MINRAMLMTTNQSGPVRISNRRHEREILDVWCWCVSQVLTQEAGAPWNIWAHAFININDLHLNFVSVLFPIIYSHALITLITSWPALMNQTGCGYVRHLIYWPSTHQVPWLFSHDSATSTCHWGVHDGCIGFCIPGQLGSDHVAHDRGSRSCIHGVTWSQKYLAAPNH